MTRCEAKFSPFEGSGKIWPGNDIAQMHNLRTPGYYGVFFCFVFCGYYDLNTGICGSTRIYVGIVAALVMTMMVVKVIKMVHILTLVVTIEVEIVIEG